jgi:hypothetical protein
MSSEKQESLISYVKRMRIAVEESRQNLCNTNEKISSLQSNLDEVSRIKGVKNMDENGLFTESIIVTEADVTQDKVVQYPYEYVNFTTALPLDLYSHIISFLISADVAALECTSRKIQKLILDGQFWISYSLKFCAKLYNRKGDNDMQFLRYSIVHLGLKRRRVLQFIEVMKEQRGVDKHKSIKKLYSRKDRNVSHPLPLFESSNTGGVDRIMSQSESFSCDFRSMALKCMQDCVELTFSLTEEIHFELETRSAVTVLVSLLANESGALQQLSCAVLANLFAADAKKKESNLPYQIKLCNGVKVLHTLLTSPSAHLNLSSGRHGSVQGMSNKEAARALVSIFAPDSPINPVYGRRDDDTELETIEEVVPVNIMLQWPKMVRYKFQYFNKSGNLKDSYTCHLAISADLFITSRGCDNIGIFELKGHPTRTIEGIVWLLSKTYLSMDEIYRNSHVGSLDEWFSEDATNQTDLILSSRAHVCYTCYYNDGLYEYNESKKRFEEIYPAGFYGVWEMASNGSHFGLEKGSVFRAVPSD